MGGVCPGALQSPAGSGAVTMETTRPTRGIGFGRSSTVASVESSIPSGSRTRGTVCLLEIAHHFQAERKR